MKRYRYSKNLEGINFQGFFSNATAYAAATTIGAFAASSEADGTLGVFNKDGTLRSTVLTAGTEFFIAQLQDGLVKRSIDLVYGANTQKGSLVVNKTVYSAPVYNKWAIGYNATSGAIGIPTLAAKQEYVVSARNLTPGNMPFPVMEGRKVIGTGDTGLSDYDICAAICQDLNGQFNYEGNGDEGFMVADIASAMTGTAMAVTANHTFTQGSTTVTVSADATSDLSGANSGYVMVIATKKVYKVASYTTGGLQYELDRPWATTSAVIADTAMKKAAAAAVAAAEVGIILTSTTEDVVFTVLAGQDLAAATLTQVTNWKQGSGAAWQVAQMEEEAAVFSGDTTINMPWRSDFGYPKRFVDPASSNHYDLSFLEYNLITPSAAPPLVETKQRGLVIIAVLTAATVQGVLDTIFNYGVDASQGAQGVQGPQGPQGPQG